MHIDPTETSANETSRAHKGDDFNVRHRVRLVHPRVGGKKSTATAEVAVRKSKGTSRLGNARAPRNKVRVPSGHETA